MTKTVYVFPLSQRGIEWLIDHDGDLEEKFRQVHRGDRIGVSLDHPHGISVMLSEPGVLYFGSSRELGRKRAAGLRLHPLSLERGSPQIDRRGC